MKLEFIVSAIQLKCIPENLESFRLLHNINEGNSMILFDFIFQVRTDRFISVENKI